MEGVSLGPYAALLFDMDGTILTSSAAAERAYAAWARRAGVSEDAVLGYFHGRRAIDTIRHFAPPSMDVDAEARWLEAYELEDLQGITAKPGAIRLLNALPADRWAVVTSSSQELARKRIAAAGLPFPDYLVSSDDITRGKPDPEGFLRGASVLGAEPNHCLVFEDTQAGAHAGFSAGADVVLVAGTHESGDLPVKAVIHDYERITIRASESSVWIILGEEKKVPA